MVSEAPEPETLPTRRAMEGQGIQVIARAAGILRALKADNSGLSLGKIARRVGLPRSTVQRIVNALVAEDLVAPNAVSGGYQLGAEILALAQAGRRDVTQMIHPIIKALSGNTGETVDLSVYRDGSMVFVDQVIGSHRLRTVSAIGEAFPMTNTANGKAALAWLDDGAVTRIATDESRRLAQGKATEAVQNEVGDIRMAGYALDIDEHTAGISAIGIAFDFRGTIYAISIPVPSQRFREAQAPLTRKLQAIKSEIARALPAAKVKIA